MQTSYLKRSLFPVFFIMAVFCFSQWAAAQRDRGGGDRGRARIVDVKINWVMSPAYQDKSTPRAKREDEWLQMMLEYETAGGDDKWIDELTFNWYVAVLPKEGKPILMERAVTYLDLEEGDHYAAMYIRPGFVKRHSGSKRINSRSIAVHVEAKLGEKEVKFDYMKGKFPKNWWQSKEPHVVFKAGELLTRLETPFAPLDYDFYEHIKLPGTK